MLINLTEDERALILRRREKAEAEALALLAKLQVIETAAKYEAWLQSNKRGSSFSTFVNEFGYQEAGADVMFFRVENVRLVAS